MLCRRLHAQASLKNVPLRSTRCASILPANYHPLAFSTYSRSLWPRGASSSSSSSNDASSSSSMASKSQQKKLQVLPFDLMPSVALERSKMYLAWSLPLTTMGPISMAWQVLLRTFGLPNTLPDLEMLRWKPVYLPYWKLDLSMMFPTRLHDQEHQVELTSRDIPFPGTFAAPLGSVPIPIPSGETLLEHIEDYEPSTHLRALEDDSDEYEGTRVVPIGYTLYPDELPEKLESSLREIRDEEVRFLADAKTNLFSAYPIYAPFFLVDYKDRKAENAANKADAIITSLMYGRSKYGRGTSPFAFWLPSRSRWTPTQVSNWSFELKAHNRNRTNVSSAPSSEPSSDVANSNSPSEGAARAAAAGSFEGSGRIQTPFHVAHLKVTAERAGTLIRDKLTNVLHGFINEAKDSPSKDAAAEAQAEASPPRVERSMEKREYVNSYADTYEENGTYMEQMSELMTAKEAVAHAKAIPASPPEGTRVLVVEPGKFPPSMKMMNSSELKKHREMAIKSAEKTLKEKAKEAESSRPGWMGPSPASE